MKTKNEKPVVIAQQPSPHAPTSYILPGATAKKPGTFVLPIHIYYYTNIRISNYKSKIENRKSKMIFSFPKDQSVHMGLYRHSDMFHPCILFIGNACHLYLG